MGIKIIAEAGVNHNGDVDLAKEMICRAKEAGADYIKFQTFVPENLVSRYASMAEYQKKATKKEQSQLQMLKSLALTKEDFVQLYVCCQENEIGFLSTPFDLESVDFLDSLKMDFWKVPSGEIENLPYLEKIGKTKKKVVLSTGMCEMHEVKAAIGVLEAMGTKDITVLHCNTEYPTPYCDVNLRAMLQMKEVLKKPVGYSDHTLGAEVAIAAAALGAVVIEKHFTVDKNMPGSDHKASLEPEELKSMIGSIRKIEICLGDGWKRRTKSEEKNCFAARKSIVAKRDILKGEIFSDKNLTVKRPGNGISPMRWHEVIGMRAEHDFKEDEWIILS